MAQSFLLVTCLVSAFVSLCSGCSSPEVTSRSFTTLDATIVSSIAYISEFSVKCSSGSVGNLYAELDGNISPVSVIGTDQFQVSWTEETKTAVRGDRVLRLFNEDGYTVYRKASRAKEDVSAVPALFTVVVNHPGAFNGPWLKSEFIATIVSLVVAYFAVVSRSKVVS